MQYRKIGFIGQGFVGGNLADNYEERGYGNLMVRYDQSEKYAGNKALIKDCDLVFVAVPTPSTPSGFNVSTLYEVIAITAPGSTVVIKSTVPPEFVRKIQELYVDRTIMLCPEFLSEDTAKTDTDYPERNLLGVSDLSVPEIMEKAECVMRTLPQAIYHKFGTYEEASLAKYGGNCFFLVKNMFFNTLYDLAESYGANWETVQEMITHDTRISPVHTNPIHKKGRGAGGHCLIKDFAAFEDMAKKLGDKNINAIIRSNTDKNIELLRSSGKDLYLLNEVYGPSRGRLPIRSTKPATPSPVKKTSLWNKIKSYVK